MSRIQAAQRVQDLRSTQQATAEKSTLTCSADAGVFEVQTLTVPSTTAADQGDFFLYENAAGDDIAVWLDIDAAGTEPDGTLYVASTTKVEVDIVTAATAADNAALVKTSIDASGASDITVVDNSDGTLTLTQDLMGPTTDIVPLDEPESGAGGFAGATVTAGVASDLQNLFFELKNGSDAAFYCWLDVNSEGADPSETGTAIAASVAAGDTATAVATAVAAGLDGNGSFDSSSSGAVVTVTNAATGNATDLGAGDSGFTVIVSVQGRAVGAVPGENGGAASISPSIITVT